MEIVRELFRHPGVAAQRIFVVTERFITAAVFRHWAAAHGLVLQAATAGSQLLLDQGAQRALIREIRDWGPTSLILSLEAPVSELFAVQNLSKLPNCWVLYQGDPLRVEIGFREQARQAA